MKEYIMFFVIHNFLVCTRWMLIPEDTHEGINPSKSAYKMLMSMKAGVAIGIFNEEAYLGYRSMYYQTLSYMGKVEFIGELNGKV